LQNLGHGAHAHAMRLIKFKWSAEDDGRRALGSTPFSTFFTTTLSGVRTPTSFQLSLRLIDGSDPKYRSTSGLMVARSKLPTKQK
jgi:hypothetical protein